MSPKFSLESDTYRVFNLDTSENTIQTTVGVVDQCGNYLANVLIYPEVISYFHIDESTVARAQYSPIAGRTNEEGKFTFPMQLDNQGGILRAEYQTSEGAIRRDLTLPSANGQQRVFQLPSCTASDTMPPSVSSMAWSTNPKSTNQTSTLTVGATDDISGVASGEYFIGDNDPGQGNGAAMDWDGTNLTNTFGTDFPTGVYKISVRAVDVAGNWSEPVSDYLVVYNPDGPRMTGRRAVVPSLANGDVLPGLTDTDQDDQATFAFNVKYNNQGQISGNSDLQFKYKTGTFCFSPNWAQNCHSLELNATSIAWLTTQGTNDSTGIFQGTASMKVDGVTSAVIFRVTGLDGERLSPSSDDHFMLKIYTEGANPNTDQPLYQVSSVVSQGNIRIVF